MGGMASGSQEKLAFIDGAAMKRWHPFH